MPLRYVFQETILRVTSPIILWWINTLGPYPRGWSSGGSKIWSSRAAPLDWDLNCVTFDDPHVVYSFHTIAFKKIRMRSTSHYQGVCIEPEVTVLQLPPPPPEEADVSTVGKQCMGLGLSCDGTPQSREGDSSPVWEHTLALVRDAL